MIKYFQFTVKLRAQIHDTPRGTKSKETFEKVRRLVHSIAASGEMLTDVYKVIFFDLLFGDYYSDEIRWKTKQKTEKELIMSIVENMAPQDKAFFAQLFPESTEDALRVDKDNVMNVFYSQFGNPKIAGVSFECIDTKMRRRKEKNR